MLTQDVVSFTNSGEKNRISAGLSSLGQPIMSVVANEKNVFSMSCLTGESVLMALYGPNGKIGVSLDPSQIALYGPNGKIGVSLDSQLPAGGRLAIASFSTDSRVQLSALNDENKSVGLYITDNNGRTALTCGIWGEGPNAGKGYFHPLDPITSKGLVRFPYSNP